MIATIIVLIWQYMAKRATEPRLSIEGVWAEYIPDSIDRQYSLGELYFDKQKGIHVFNGTNFQNSGNRYCHWDTVTSYIDTNSNRFFYIFSAQLEGELDKLYYGFGVVNLARRASDQALVPVDGHYVSANVDDGKPKSHSMVNVSKMNTPNPCAAMVSSNCSITSKGFLVLKAREASYSHSAEQSPRGGHLDASGIQENPRKGDYGDIGDFVAAMALGPTDRHQPK